MFAWNATTRVQLGSQQNPKSVTIPVVTPSFPSFSPNLVQSDAKSRNTALATMAYPENVGIKAMDIYVPAQVSPFSNRILTIPLPPPPRALHESHIRVSDQGKSVWTKPSSRSTKACPPASTPSD